MVRKLFDTVASCNQAHQHNFVFDAEPFAGRVGIRIRLERRDFMMSAVLLEFFLPPRIVVD
jgi:hypothetical protein